MVKENISKINERIARVCSRVGRDPGGITVVAVTKGRAAGQIQEAIDCGISDIGENRVQEAVSKYNALYAKRYTLNAVKWHMVGHLQTNKVKDALKLFELIQSVDSLRLAREIDKYACGMNKVQNILIEVKTSEEATKFGLKPETASDVIKKIACLKNINIAGLMTIAPLADNPEKARPYFKMLRQLRDRIYESQVLKEQLRILSMGMTDDFEVAIEEGATMVRLGRAIFENYE
jgi:hypothetical protein